jgi:prepilin signal peptidase PulO-like enzyme (type II secretory pathway)
LSGIDLLVTAYLVIAGLMVGSFVGLAADRLPKGESVVRPGSHCRSCGRRLNVVDLLPVAGYFLRRGRCASCGTPIGITSAVIEAMCGGLMAVAILWLGLWPGAAVGAVLVGGWGLAVVALAIRRGSRPGTASVTARHSP